MFYSVIPSGTSHAPAAYSHYIELLQHAGAEGFHSVVSQALEEVGIDEFFVCLHRREDEPPQVVVSTARPDAEQRVAAYRNRFFRHEPLKRLLGELGDQPFLVTRLAATDLVNPTYRRVCFEEPGFTEKVIVLQRVPDGWLTLNLLRRSREHVSDAGLPVLRDLIQMLMPIVATHARLTAAREQPLSIPDIQMRIAATFPSLSPREQAVCARTLAGVTAEGIGLDLGIKQTTVLTYRRRAYERLNISTVHQLSTMLIR